MNTTSSPIATLSDSPPLARDEHRRDERVSLTSRRRLLRFATFEAIAIAVFVLSITAEVYFQSAKGVLTMLTIVAAIAIGVVPVVVYGPERSR